MKRSNIYKVSLGLFIGSVLLNSCTKDFEQINKPPTSVTTIDPALLLSRSLRDGSFYESGELPNNKFGSWVQHWAGGPIVPTSRYIEAPENAIWSQHYDLLKNLMQIRQELKGKEDLPEGRSKLAIARIYEIYIWQRMTDLFGDLPFSAVTQDAGAIQRTPAFDKQEDIYPVLIQQLDAALARLNAADNSYGTADFFYGGNVSKWAKFGNSLKLKLGMRLRYANAQLAQKTVTEAIASPYGLLSSNADNAAVPTFNNAQAENYNPMLRQFITGSSDIRYLANTLVNTLKNYNDPRLPLIAAPTASSAGTGTDKYEGIGVALTDNQLAQIIRANYSTASTKTWFSISFAPIPSYALTYSEVAFFRAEAALLGWDQVDAEKTFQDAVKAAFAVSPYNMATVPQTYIDQVLSFNGLSADQRLEKIQTQKWIHLFGRNFEAFAEWRRTGYPVLTPGPMQGSTNGKIPRRAIYSSEEAQLNEANYKAAVERMSNGDSFLSKVWWDKK
ncbi:SusD/RagB family nutrient-binding outer membrane lipoprotein [Sphingobacterium spiritivorum]|uniref:SusD/RagB family nutrient-binding outer membrane lipoprotein n=1 Tax=Sphingobacterium spiritivorum TaxID=258 RepID=UPI003DA2310F